MTHNFLFSLSLSLSLSQTHTHTHTYTFDVSVFFFNFSVSVFHTSFCLSNPPLSLSLSLTHTHTHTLDESVFFLYQFLCFYLSLPLLSVCLSTFLSLSLFLPPSLSIFFVLYVWFLIQLITLFTDPSFPPFWIFSLSSSFIYGFQFLFSLLMLLTFKSQCHNWRFIAF